MNTPRTKRLLQAFIVRDYQGSQAGFSRACGLDTADTSRVLTTVRPVSLGFVKRAMAALDERDAARLAEAFLNDVLAELPGPCAVTVQRHPAAGASCLDERPISKDTR